MDIVNMDGGVVEGAVTCEIEDGEFWVWIEGNEMKWKEKNVRERDTNGVK